MEVPHQYSINFKLKETKLDSDSQSTASSPTKKSPKVLLGPEQAKKRLLAFAQQWNKTKEVLNKETMPPKPSSKSGSLQYTYLVEGIDGNEKSYPSHVVKFTKTEPSISYCENLTYCKGIFKSRKEIWDASDESSRSLMFPIMNPNPSNASHSQPVFFGRYRKWYLTRTDFIGKPLFKAENHPQEENGVDRKQERYSPHWETDSEEDTHDPPLPSYLDFIPSPPKPINIKLVSKVKINKVELPFFEDDDYLESLLSSSQSKVKMERVEEIPIPTTEMTIKVEEQFPLPEVKEKQECDFEGLPDGNSVLSKDTEFCEDPPQVEHRTPSPVITEDLNKESLYHDRRKERERSKSNSYDEDNDTDDPPLYDDIEMNPIDNVASGVIEFGFYEEFERNDADLSAQDAKRISLDERLELELGIKAEVVDPVLQAQSLVAMEQFSFEESPLKKRRGFGPKAAPMGPLIYSCSKALPFAPYVAPHLQLILYRPLVKSQPQETCIMPEEAKEEEKKEDKPKKDWDVELKNLEAAASNLEVADEKVLEDIEEKLLLFEAINILPSSRIESPQTVLDSNELKKKPSKRPKRDKPPPIELKAAGKGILVMPRISLINEEGVNQKKNVMFADNIKPGDGTSSSEGEETSPPLLLPVVSEVLPASQKQKKKKRRRFKKCTEEVLDPKYDLLPPPPPPPGSPPPHLPQGRSLTPPTSFTVTTDLPIENSPLSAPFEGMMKVD